MIIETDYYGLGLSNVFAIDLTYIRHKQCHRFNYMNFASREAELYQRCYVIRLMEHKPNNAIYGRINYETKHPIPT